MYKVGGFSRCSELPHYPPSLDTGEEAAQQPPDLGGPGAAEMGVEP
jgi:hypothetical protein